MPDGFPLWVLSITSDSSLSNCYPDHRNDWWFYRDDSTDVTEIIENDEPPTFHASEYPLGTILSIITMMAALGIMTKRVPKL
jgi:hypothetical protein